MLPLGSLVIYISLSLSLLLAAVQSECYGRYVAVYFTADPHFGHTKIISLCNRPFADLDEMHEVMVERWNQVVRPGDLVWCLGDVAMGDRRTNLEWVRRLNGNKRLLPGNHDNCHPMHKRAAAWTPVYEGVGFDIRPVQVVATVGGRFVDLCHFPAHGDHYTDDRYPDWRPLPHPDRPLVHGHVHDLWKNDGRQVNIGVDVWDFTPVSQDQLAAAFDAQR